MEGRCLLAFDGRPSRCRSGPAVLAGAFTDYPWTRWTVEGHRHGERVEGLQRLSMDRTAVPSGRLRSPAMAVGDMLSVAVGCCPFRPCPRGSGQIGAAKRRWKVYDTRLRSGPRLSSLVEADGSSLLPGCRSYPTRSSAGRTRRCCAHADPRSCGPRERTSVLRDLRVRECPLLCGAWVCHDQRDRRTRSWSPRLGDDSTTGSRRSPPSLFNLPPTHHPPPPPHLPPQRPLPPPPP